MSAPKYFCQACPATFADGPTANAHHDATGHHQTWKPHRGFGAEYCMCAAVGAEQCPVREHREPTP